MMIVDGNDEFRRRIVDGLKRKPDVQIVADAGDGLEALRAVIDHRPDVLLMELALPGMDGIGLLRALGRLAGPRPKVIVLTAICTEAVIRMAMAHGAAYFIVKPSGVELLYERTLDVMACEAAASFCPNEFTEPGDGAQFVDAAVREGGIPANLKGYRDLCCAVKLAIADRSLLRAMNKRLYPEVARLHGTSIASVERNIRHAIGAARLRGVLADECARMSNREMVEFLIERVYLYRKARE